MNENFSHMDSLKKISKFIPYFYFISLILYGFTHFNRTTGSAAYLILFLSFPFIWQLIRPTEKLNFLLGTTVVCLSSYVILAFLCNLFNIIALSESLKYSVTASCICIASFVMALWMIRNSLRKRFSYNAIRNSSF